MAGSDERRGDGQGTRSRRSQRSGRQRHLYDHLAILRVHALWGVVAALVVFGLMMWRALQMPAVYASEAVLHLDVRGDSGEGAVVSPMTAFDQVSGVEAEVAILRSFRLAREAAADPGSPCRAIVAEEDAFEPLDELLRRVRRKAGVVHLVAEIDGPVELPASASLAFEAGAEGKGPTLVVRRRVDGVDVEERYEDFHFGEPYTDVDDDGVYDEQEPWTDVDGNGAFDAPEEFTDLDGNGTWSADEPFEDVDGDGRRDAGEPFEDVDHDGLRRAFAETYVDRNGNGRYDGGDPWEDLDGDYAWSAGDTWRDLDGNGRRDRGDAIPLGGRSVWLVRASGDPVGRRFHLDLLTDEQAAYLLHGSARAVGRSDYSGLVTVGATADSPWLARAIVASLVRTYLARKQVQKEEKADRLLSWLRRETKRVRGELGNAYRQRDEFIRRTGAVLLSERAQAASAEAGALIRERLQLEFEQRRLRYLIDALGQDRSPSELLPLLGQGQVDATTVSLLDQHTALQIELGTYAAAGETSRQAKVAEAQARLEQTERLLDGAARRLAAERRGQYGNELANVTARLDQVREQERRQRLLLRDLPELEQAQVEMNRPVLELEQARTDLAKWVKDTQVAKAATVSSARLIDEARLNPARVSPNLVREALIALVLALAAGIGVCYLREYLDRKVKTPAELEAALGLPVYATIPAFRSVPARDRPRRRRPLVAADRPKSLISEAYRTLRASLRHENREHPVRTIAITSPSQEEGKSITTANLAATMGLAGDRVIVVDTDLRRPKSHLYAQHPRTPGLTDVLSDGLDWRDVRQEGPLENVTFLHAGRDVANPSALIDSPAFRTLIGQLAGAYDYVLFDVPPVLAVADATAFLHQLDAVLLLTHYGRYPVDVAEDAYDQLVRAGADVRGIVLNAFDARRSGASRYYGRYGYTRYGYR